MPLSDAAERCLQEIRGLPDAMDSDVCTGIQDKIVAHLCGADKGLTVPNPTWKEGVYAL